MDKKWFITAELVGVPGMPGTQRGVLLRTRAAGYESRKRKHGKGYEYALSSLPDQTQAYLKGIALMDVAQEALKVVPKRDFHLIEEIRALRVELAAIRRLQERSANFFHPISVVASI